MMIVSEHRKALSREVGEGVLIQEARAKGKILNSKKEWYGEAVPRISIDNGEKVEGDSTKWGGGAKMKKELE